MTASKHPQEEAEAMVSSQSMVPRSVLQELLGDIGDGVILTDAQERVVFLNPAARKLLDLPDRDLGAVYFEDICHLVNVKTGRPYLDPLARAMRKKHSVGLARNIGILRGAQQIFLSATCSPILSSEGEVVGCSVIFRDITHMRQLEMKIELDHIYMRAVFSAAKVGLCVLDESGAIVNINDAGLEMMETTYPKVYGQQFGDAFRCENSYEKGCGHGSLCPLCPIRRNIEAAMMDDDFTSEFTASMHSRMRSEPIWLKIFVSQTATENKKQIVLSLIDDSVRKKREQALEDARQRAESVSRRKSEFLANMSHEIRTPINGMNGMIELTLHTELTEEQRENLVSARQCSEDLLRVINDILDFSKMEHGRLELEHIGFDLHENLRRICRVHSKILRRKGLYFQPPRYADIPRLVRGDPMRFRQILHNLLTNATKFTEEGGVTVTASCGTRRGQPSLEITVRDTGIGMSVEEQQKLFQPFSQVDGSITRRFGGSGLGLTIVKKLIVLMGGEIEVHSAPTIGSVFSFWLPLEEADAVEEELQNRSVFLNPHFEQRNTGQGKVPPGQQPVPKINPVKAEQDDLGDIRSLLAYCEGKLEDGNADTSAETGADHPEQQGGISK